MNLLLLRDPAAGGARTFGVLAAPSLQTLERPWVPAAGWLGGHPDTSCVPPGFYQLVLHDTAEHPQTWALVCPALGIYHEPGDVPAGQTGRFGCLIHQANLVEQLAGCIGVGLSLLFSMDGEPDIAESAAAFQELKAAVPWTAGHSLTIL